jgi:hypothetical protein
MPVRHPAVTVTAVATILGLVLTVPLAHHLSDSIYGIAGDNIGTIGVYWNWLYAIEHGLSPFDNRMWGAPFGAGWDTVPFGALQVGVSIPLTFLMGAIATYNLEILSSFPLIAWTTFLLGRRLGLSPLAAGFAALAFTFVPYHTMKANGHLGPTHLEFLPAFLLFGVRWRQGGSRWNLVAAGGLLGLSAWLDPTLTFVMCPLVIAMLLASLLTSAPNRWSSAGSRLRDHLVAFGLLGAVAALFLPVFLLVWHRPGTGSWAAGFAATNAAAHRKLLEATIYSARIGEYITPWVQNPLTPSWVKDIAIRNLHGSNFFEQSLSMGYTVIALALLGLLLTRRAFPIVLAMLAILLGVVMSLQPHPTVAGVRLVAPSLYLYQVLPFFRVYASFAMLVLLGTILLGGFGVAALERKLGAGRRRWLLLLPFLLVGVEFNNLPPRHVTKLLPAPAEYTWLREQPPGILVEYPLAAGDPPSVEFQTRTYQFYQQVHEHPIFNGAAPGSRADNLAPDLEPYFRPGVVRQLAQLGIRYVFVHVDAYNAAGLKTPIVVSGLGYVGRVGGADIFVVGG